MTFTSIPCMNLFASEGENVKENLGAELDTGATDIAYIQ